MNELLSKVRKFLESRDDVGFAYLFGSMAENTAGPLSDIDTAVYLKATEDLFRKRLLLMEELGVLLGTEKLDLIVLNEAPIVLKNEIIRNGIILKEERSMRIPFEVEVLREYLDTAYLRSVQRESLKEYFSRGTHG